MRLSKLKASNTKKLDITGFFEESEEKEYIYIKKLDYSVKKKLELMASQTASAKAGKEMMRQMKKKGYAIKDIDSLTQDQQLEMFIDMETSDEETLKLVEATTEIARLILNEGVDKKKHSFLYDDDDEPVEMDYEFINHNFSEELINFIIAQIKIFSQGFELGK